MKLRMWCAAAAALPLGLLAVPAHAESSFTALASATAVDTTVANDDLPLVTVLEAAGPSAGVSWDSTGQGTAFASNPYPGTTVAELPGTAAGLTGLPVPAYPLFVATTSDDAPADYAQPGVVLHASCQGKGVPECQGSSLAGTAPATTQARSSITQPGPDEVVATAMADSGDFSLPGGVTLSGSHTSATVTLKDGRVTRHSELTVSRLTIGGTQAFTIKNGTVLLAGSEIPVPFATLDSALHAVGVEADFAAGSQSRWGVVAPILRLRTVLPAGPAVLSHPTAVAYTVGGADASVTLGAFRVDVSSGVVRHEPTTPIGTSTPVAAIGPPLAEGGQAAPVSLPGVAAAAPEQAPVTQVPQATPASAPTQVFDVADIYLALVLCGVVWFGATQALRIFGVRFRWTS